MAMLPKGLGFALVLVGLLGFWSFHMGWEPDSLILKVSCQWLIIACTLMGWHVALGLVRPDFSWGRGLITMILLIVLHLTFDGLSIMARVAGVRWSYLLATGMDQYLFLGAWLVGFKLFRQAVGRLPGRAWHLPLALALGGLSLASFACARTLQPYLLVAWLTLVIFGLYLMVDLIHRS